MTLTQINKAGLDELALDHVFTIGASGTDHYTFQGEGLNGTVNDPTLYLTRGKTYRFENGTGAHPIRIQSTSGASGTAYNTGVTNNAGSGTVIVEVQHDAPDVLYYQCTSHANMNGVLYITGALADGGVTTAKLADDAVTDAKLANSINTAIAANTAKTTNATHTGDVTGSGSLTIANDAVTTAKIANIAVTTAKLSNDSVTADKIAANAVGSSELANDSVGSNALADNAVDTAAIADNAVNMNKLSDLDNGRIIARVSGGAGNPEAATAAQVRNVLNVADGATQTTINNNADNRVITGSGTANTLEGESTLLYDSTTLTLNKGGLTNGQKLTIKGSGNSAGDDLTFNNWGNSDGDYWLIGVNVTGNSGGSHTKTTDALRHSGIIIDGRMGRVILTASETSTSTKSDSHTFERNGDIKMNGALYLNGDTAAANALDDYEEGSWTPEISFGNTTTGQSYNTQVGRYTKIGNRCYVTCYVRFSNKGSSTGTARLGGLPFTTANISGFYQHGSVWINTWNGSSTVPTGYTETNTTTFRFERQRADGGGTGVSAMDNTNFNNTTDVMISLHYQVN